MKIRDIILEAGEVPIYYFAYGMLTDPNIMSGADFLGVATLPNFRYEMLAYANVVPDTGSKVYGCLWSLDRRMIAKLDQIEGYPELYDRKTVPAYVNGQKYVAELYTMTPATRKSLNGTQPTVRYIQQIYRGYSAGGVPLQQLEMAVGKSGVKR
jgi:gamma-glutamylcyclotransferase (GGCT)/AIG2-like uncharacterized protein YtfP